MRTREKMRGVRGISIGLLASLCLGTSGLASEIRPATDDEIARADRVNRAFRLETGKTGVRYVQIDAEIADYVEREVRESLEHIAQLEREHPDPSVRWTSSTSADVVLTDDELAGGQSPAYELTVDGKKVEIRGHRPRAFTFEDPNSFHRERLELGVHSVVIRATRRADPLLYDGEILVDGLSPLGISLNGCSKPSSACSVRLLRYDEVLFERLQR